jgi:exosortase/archaeosortase
MNFVEQTAAWLWLTCYVLGALFVFFGFAAAVILALSREMARAAELVVLVTVIGLFVATFVAVSFGYDYQNTSGEGRIALITITLACVTLTALLFGYFRAFKLFIK